MQVEYKGITEEYGYNNYWVSAMNDRTGVSEFERLLTIMKEPLGILRLKTTHEASDDVVVT